MVFGAAGGKYIATALAQVSEYQSFIYNYYAASLSAKILCFLYSFACFFVLSISSNFLLLLLFFDFDFNFWSVKGKNGTTWQTCLWRTKFISHFNGESFLKPLLLQEHLKIHKYTKPSIFNCEVSELVFCSGQGSDLKAQACMLGKRKLNTCILFLCYHRFWWTIFGLERVYGTLCRSLVSTANCFRIWS